MIDLSYINFSDTVCAIAFGINLIVSLVAMRKAGKISHNLAKPIVNASEDDLLTLIEYHRKCADKLENLLKEKK